MTEINKKALSERDICTKYITPALAHAGWDVLTQIREEVAFTAGKIMVKGRTVKRGKAKRADYIEQASTSIFVRSFGNLLSNGVPAQLIEKNCSSSVDRFERFPEDS